MQATWRDIQYGLKFLVSSPSFFFAALVAMALAIGANTAVYSVVNTVLISPLPFSNSDRLVMLWENKIDRMSVTRGVSGAMFADLAANVNLFTNVSIQDLKSASLSGIAQPERLRVQVVSPNFFELLEVKPLFGQLSLSKEEVIEKIPVVILSYFTWQKKFALDKEVIGKKVTLDGIDTTIIGVLTQDFQSPITRNIDLWTPVPLSVGELSNRGLRSHNVIAKLRPGITIDSAQRQLESLAHRLEQENPATNTGWGIQVVSLTEQVVGDVRELMLILSIAVILVLLVASANVASLLLARLEPRRKELALRAALGATRGRIIRQLLTESILLTFFSGIIGIIIAYWAIQFFLSFDPLTIPRLQNTRLDKSVLVFNFMISSLTGLICGIVPAIKFSTPDLNTYLKEGAGTSTSGKQRNLVRNFLVIIEVALVFIVLSCLGLVLRSFQNLQPTKPGFDRSNKLTFVLSLPQHKYPEVKQQRLFFQQAVENIQALPQVSSVALISDLPLTGSYLVNVTKENAASTDTQDKIRCHYRAISSNYFNVMKVPLLKGRKFSELDDERASPMVIINEAMAQRFGGSDAALGQQLIILDKETSIKCEIVGVVGNVRFTGADTNFRPEIYVPYLQKPNSYSAIIVDSKADVSVLSLGIRNQIARIDAGQALDNFQTLEKIVTDSVGQQRFFTLLISGFGIIALILAIVGVYGITAFFVTERTKEIGIRMALGSQRAAIFKLVMGKVTKLILTGIVLGWGGAFLATSYLESLLYSVDKMDLFTLMSTSVLLLVVASIACYIPTRRAMNISPSLAIRHE